MSPNKTYAAAASPRPESSVNTPEPGDVVIHFPPLTPPQGKLKPYSMVNMV